MKYGFLLVVAWFAGICAIVWVYRRRKDRQSRAAEQRMREMFGDQFSAPAAAPAGNRSQAGAARRAAPAPGYVRRNRLLDPHRTALFSMLQAELSGCVVLARVNLAAVLDVAAGSAQHERDQRLRRIASDHADFVVCGGDFSPLAVVDFDSGAGVPGQARKAESLAEAGVRYVTLSLRQFPPRGTLRAVVLGDVSAGAGASPGGAS